MGNALSMALRVRFRNLMDGGLRAAAAAAGKMLLLSPATAARWGKKVRDGDPLEPLPSVPRKGERQTGTVCLVLRGADRAGPRHHSG